MVLYFVCSGSMLCLYFCSIYIASLSGGPYHPVRNSLHNKIQKMYFAVDFIELKGAGIGEYFYGIGIIRSFFHYKLHFDSFTDV